MKKLTKIQKEIEALAKRLSKPCASFRKWDLRLRAEKEWEDSVMVYESFYSTSGRFAIERTFEVGKDYCNEVAQWWIDTNTGKSYYRERKSTLIYGGNYGYRFQGYDFNTPFKFKPKSGMVDQYGYRFVNPYQRGEARITKELERKGATQDDVNKFGIKKLTIALTDARMETILKHSVKDFYWLMKSGYQLTDALWTAYKITIRHNYHIRNMQMWRDLVEQMAYLGMDVHNPKFVCARAYKRLHDELVRKADRKREKERRIAEEKKNKEIMEKNKALFDERISKFGDLSISNGSLHSVVLLTYSDYQEEGRAMHHCVGGYYDKAYALILSMRNSDGKRVETVEVSLNTFSIVQSRGVCNNSTSRHKEIVDLVNENMWQIRERAEGRRIAMAC